MGMLLTSSCTDNTSAEGTTDETSTESVDSNLQDSLSYALGILLTKDLGKPTFDTIYPTEFIQAMDDYFNQSSTMEMNEAGQMLQNAVAKQNCKTRLQNSSAK